MNFDEIKTLFNLMLTIKPKDGGNDENIRDFYFQKSMEYEGESKKKTDMLNKIQVA